MVSSAVLVLVFALAADGGGSVRVSASGPGLAVVARGAPLSVVLEEIGRHSGIRVTFEGGAPKTLLTCDFAAATPAEAFLRALEGNGLNYALHGATPDNPGTLLISAPSSAVASTGATATVQQAERSAATVNQTEPFVEVQSPDDPESPSLVAPPPGGAQPRFMHQAEAEAGEGLIADGGRASGDTGATQTIDDKASPPPNSAGGRPRGRMGPNNRRGGAGSPQN